MQCKGFALGATLAAAAFFGVAAAADAAPPDPLPPSAASAAAGARVKNVPAPPAAAARWRGELVRAAHLQWGLYAPIAAMAAQVQQESGWNAQAVSRVGARGMAQFMPTTARWWCQRERIAEGDCQPHNPTWALRALAGYDAYLYKRMTDYFPHLSRFDRLWLALRGYNGGEGNVTKEAATLGLKHPTRRQIDAACGARGRSSAHCRENTTYPRRILLTLQPRYAAWGAVWTPDDAPAQSTERLQGQRLQERLLALP